MQDTPEQAPVDDLTERRRKHEAKTQARFLAEAQEAIKTQGHTFTRLHRNLPNTSGSNRMKLALADPAIEGDMWADLGQKVKDRRFLIGEDGFRTAKKSDPVKASAPRTQSYSTTDTDRAIDQIRELECPDYLPAIAGVEALPGGRCHCPLPVVMHSDGLTTN